MSESGQTLVELLVMMAILMTILVAVTDALISGTHAETNVEHRLNTQSGLRLALTRMRQDVHCAYDVQSVDYNATNQGFTLSLTEFYNTCKAVDSSGSSSSKVQLLWCTVPATAGSTTVYNLYRGNTTCDATSQLIATNLVAPAAGWPTNSLASSATSWNGNIWPDAGTCTTDYLKVLPIDMAVNSDQTGTPNGAYELKDAIALRNSTRCGTTSGGTSGTQARPALSMSVPLAMIVEHDDGRLVDGRDPQRQQQSVVPDHHLPDDRAFRLSAVDLHRRQLDDRRHRERDRGRQLHPERRRLHPDRRRQLLVVCLLRGRHQRQGCEYPLPIGCRDDRRGLQVEPDPDGLRSGGGHHGRRDPGVVDQRDDQRQPRRQWPDHDLRLPRRVQPGVVPRRCRLDDRRNAHALRRRHLQPERRYCEPRDRQLLVVRVLRRRQHQQLEDHCLQRRNDEDGGCCLLGLRHVGDDARHGP